MISTARIKKVEAKIDEIDLARKKEEEYVSRMFPNERCYKFQGHLIAESVIDRIIGKDRKTR